MDDDSPKPSVRRKRETNRPKKALPHSHYVESPSQVIEAALDILWSEDKPMKAHTIVNRMSFGGDMWWDRALAILCERHDRRIVKMKAEGGAYPDFSAKGARRGSWWNGELRTVRKLVECAANLGVTITPGGMQYRLEKQKWSVRKAVTTLRQNKGPENRSKTTGSKST